MNPNRRMISFYGTIRELCNLTMASPVSPWGPDLRPLPQNIEQNLHEDSHRQRRVQIWIATWRHKTGVLKMLSSSHGWSWRVVLKRMVRLGIPHDLRNPHMLTHKQVCLKQLKLICSVSSVESSGKKWKALEEVLSPNTSLPWFAFQGCLFFKQVWLTSGSLLCGWLVGP